MRGLREPMLAAVTAAAAELLRESYENGSRVHHTVSFVREYLVQAGMVGKCPVPSDFKLEPTRAQGSLVRSALERLVRRGLCVRELGPGLRTPEAYGYHWKAE